MITFNLVVSRPLQLGLSIGFFIVCIAATAAPRIDDSAATARYRQERAVCIENRSNQDRATCLREAISARADARRGGLDDGLATYTANAVKRCEPLPEAQRAACEARMRGSGRTEGDAASGGIYRELVTPDTADPAR